MPATRITPVKRQQLEGLLAYVLSACIFILFFKPPYLLSIIIVLGPPSLMNFLWLSHSRLKVLAFSFLTTLLFAPPIELATRLANAWDVQSVLPRPFGLIPLENMLFAFFNFFWGISFYIHFVGRDTRKPFSPRIRYLVMLYLVLSALVYGLFFHSRHIISTSYVSMSVPILLLPSLFIFSRYPRLLPKILLPTAFFAVVFFVYEVCSLVIGSWWWPGEYLYTISVFGHSMPLDDVVIWYFLSTPTLIAGYEYFADYYP